MTKEEAYKFLMNISYALGNMSIEYLTEKDGEKMREAIEILQQEPWVPVSEDSPKENETVIVSTKYGVCPEAKYTKENGWHWISESGVKNYWTELEDVEAWMPLPERYNAESEVEK